MTTYARRTDRNHAEFAELFQRCGYQYIDTHRFGGMLDFLVMSHHGRMVLFEVKDATKPAPLTDAERETLAKFAGSAFVVTTPERAREILMQFDEED